ncbi:hypothetical protein EC912_105119 [Luteibacter rhizovicinus]|uniref:Peptidase C13 n=1 Tax=Luteibacter rhizovicinus TaxID=242606 RepID=A0A4V2W3T5_9GAMM|nr:peptidase C13 [Luteibacter rhizovicinus]TCV93259.1 hypothetical protein EC912_105119 [Luteibacter rhizovicinus]
MLSTLLALATLATPDFADRMLAAKKLEATADGTAYQKRLWDSITDQMTVALESCIASNAPADRSPFTVVANVGADGRVSGVAIKPATPVAGCFSGQFATWLLPVPPKLPAPYPIEIDVSLTR